MNGNDTAARESLLLQKGFQPKAYVTKVIQGQSVQIPLSQIKITPPTSGTGVITPKQK